MKFSEKNIKKVVSLLKGFYLVITTILTVLIIVLIAIVFILLLNQEYRAESLFSTLIEGLIAALFGGAIYFGLKNKKSWIVPVMVFTASLTFISQLFYNTDSPVKLIVKVFGLSLALFEIYFFTRKEVKEYFGTKGIFLFGR